MAKNITLMGASYSDVPAVTLPKTGGGTARFDDASVTTATAADVASGKVFLAADGQITTGTASGGGGGDNTFIVTLIYDNTDEMWVPDCTYQDAYDAYYQGKEVLAKIDPNAGDYFVAVGFSFDFSGAAYTVYSNYYYHWWAYLWYGDEVVPDGDYQAIEPYFQTVSKTYTPTESQQTEVVTYDTSQYYNGLEQVNVTVNAISPTYVGSGITHRSSSDLTASGAIVTVPSGYYSAQTSKAVTSGSAGTPTATKGTVSNHSVSVTPSVTNTTGYITGSTKTGTAVTVSASELVSGNLAITQNGNNIDVTNYETVSVNVSGGGGKNVQVNSNSYSRQANSYGATNLQLTVAKTGTYKVSWTAWRSSSSGTMGTNLHRNSTSGTDQQTFTNTYGQHIVLNNQSYTQGDVLTLYATSGSNSRLIWVSNLIIEEQ